MKAFNLSRVGANFPTYPVFRLACRSGLSTVRCLEESARADDSLGWNFGNAWPPSHEAFGRMRALITMADARALNPKSVLEVAAGDAALCSYLATCGARVVANDLRKENLEQSVRHFKNRDAIELRLGNLLELDPADTGTFDLVVACEIIEHVAHTVQFLRQLRRFVAPGGQILLTTPNGTYFRNKLPTHSMIQDFNALESHQFKPDADGHLFLITPTEMVSLAAQAGLKVERMVVWGTPFLTGHCRLALFESDHLCWLSYRLERLAQRLPMAIRGRLCFALCAVFGVQ
jgi:2-polyprenyl-3-methyl-5-hydroxy-6-metoxy-1,4-benzoquinol methylase